MLQQQNNEEQVSMSEAIDDIAADVLSMYLYNFNSDVSEEEKIEKLSEMFNLSVHEIEEILKDE